MHTNLFNNKKYVGITKVSEEARWNNGNGYKDNEKFYPDIKKYGWDNGFSHEIIKENLSYKDARILERYYIEKYNSVSNGYNKVNFNLGSSFKFDFDNFIPIDNKYLKNNNEKQYFTRVPNEFVQCNIKEKYNLNRIFYVVYIMIDRHRSYEDTSYIVISELLNLCGYKQTRHKPKIFFEIIKCLLFLCESNMIEITSDFDIYNVDYSDCIQMNIICSNFDYPDKFTKLTSSQFDVIMMADSSLNRENILMAFLYINSYIGCRRKKDDGSDLDSAKDNPEAFWRSIESMAKELAMSKDTINQCIEYLTTSSEDSPALLVKREVGSVQPDKNKPPKNVPNIYVLNKEGYEKEIEWALNKMKEIYEVDEFYPLKGNYKNDK